MNAFITVFYDWSRIAAAPFAWAGPLLVRLVVGWVFLWSGWQKLHILPRMIENFRSWGIPAPEILTPFVSGVEFVGGLLLLLGLLTRFISVPMMIVMLVASEGVSGFLERHPTFKVLALSFILMIGVLLIAEGLHFHVPRGYLYFAFGFSAFVEAVNTAVRRRVSKSKKD